MKEIKFTELSHDDLVDILSTATYGDESLDIRVPRKCKDFYEELDEDACWEDRLANVLEKGGYLVIYDNNSEEPKDGWTCEGNVGLECVWKEFKTWNTEEQGEWGHVGYRVYLKDILNGCSTEQGYKFAKKLLIDEDGDFYTAYNLMQIILFGELVY